MGDYLVEHPRCRFINFTGSKEVGLAIGSRAAAVQPGQPWLKRVFLEMGGKDAMVVDETADLEAAAAAVVAKRLRLPGSEMLRGFPPHCRRAVYDTFLERLVAATEVLTVGPAEENYPVAAVISEEQQQKILAEIDRGKS